MDSPIHRRHFDPGSSLIDLHKALVERDSTTGSENNVTPFVTDYLRSKGFTVKVQVVQGTRENVYAYIGPSPHARVLLTSHIDTVPPYLPYERRGDEIWGRGSVDAKGCVAAQINAVESLLAASQISKGDVALLYVVGEEVDNLGTRAANQVGLSWEAVVFGEPTELKLASGEKGEIAIRLTAHGKAGHSGYPESGESAIAMLVRALASLDCLELPWNEKYGNTTINVGTIEGGVSLCVIAENASAGIFVRVVDHDLVGLKRQIETAVHSVAPNVKIDFTTGKGPSEIDHDIAGKSFTIPLTGFETVVVNYGSDIPHLDGNHKRYLYGPGTILVAHSDHEHLKISDMELAVEGYKVIITHLLKK
ncbi:hypothetical protein EDD37DRAFT_692780 [Exophiala viscosa]|uniref:Peptidase M20 dimerisation domain-containing protein n=1 Tax=Exophiala viscosa TaxID=2486360 RepID=A0AAN6DUA3_9EURO|nr:hypothetical protein EDD36DRAFT_495953 [Exophiala viscosa]KAI1625759.1 hypothetical protein EDD37DRAFT_692780 [Exophiala viscosa]